MKNNLVFPNKNIGDNSGIILQFSNAVSVWLNQRQQLGSHIYFLIQSVAICCIT